MAACIYSNNGHVGRVCWWLFDLFPSGGFWWAVVAQNLVKSLHNLGAFEYFWFIFYYFTGVVLQLRSAWNIFKCSSIYVYDISRLCAIVTRCADSTKTPLMRRCRECRTHLMRRCTRCRTHLMRRCRRSRTHLMRRCMTHLMMRCRTHLMRRCRNGTTLIGCNTWVYTALVY